MTSMDLPSFEHIASQPDPGLDLLALALAAEFRPVDAAAALAELEALGEEVARATNGLPPQQQTEAVAEVLGQAHGFAGDTDRYDHPQNSMLDAVLERRRGLPILLSVVYAEAARRARIPIAGVGLPGHFVVAHFGADPPLLLDPFNGGAPVVTDAPDDLIRPWRSVEIAMRMLNNLVPAFEKRGNVGAAIRAARLRLALPADARLSETLETELLSLEARLN